MNSPLKIAGPEVIAKETGSPVEEVADNRSGVAPKVADKSGLNAMVWEALATLKDRAKEAEV
jgi:hypothetical protein